MDERIDDILLTARKTLRIPSSLDAAVLSAAAGGPAPRRIFTHSSLLTVSFLLLAAGTFFLTTSVLPKKNMERDCLRILSDMTKAVETKDVGKSLAFYLPGNLPDGKLEENIRVFYGRYDTIRYEISDVRIKTIGREAVAETRYELTAVNANETLRYAGTDRIYLTREAGRLRIRHWIDG